MIILLSPKSSKIVLISKAHQIPSTSVGRRTPTHESNCWAKYTPPHPIHVSMSTQDKSGERTLCPSVCTQHPSNPVTAPPHQPSLAPAPIQHKHILYGSYTTLTNLKRVQVSYFKSSQNLNHQLYEDFTGDYPAAAAVGMHAKQRFFLSVVLASLWRGGSPASLVC